ncbi:MAG: tryptophan synthase subunit alpha, partial [Acidobacteriaceae bacterium]
DVLALARDLRATRPHTGLIIFSYLNPIIRYGLERFMTDAKAAGVDGVLATDLTIEEAEGKYLDGMRATGLSPIFLAAPTSTDDRLARIAAVSQGFVYAISRVGITGTQQSLASDARSLVERLRRCTKLPIALGFGVSNANHVAALGEFTDAAVIGSAIVGLIEKTAPQDAPAAVAQFIEALRPVAAVQTAR